MIVCAFDDNWIGIRNGDIIQKSWKEIKDSRRYSSAIQNTIWNGVTPFDKYEIEIVGLYYREDINKKVKDLKEKIKKLQDKKDKSQVDISEISEYQKKIKIFQENIDKLPKRLAAENLNQKEEVEQFLTLEDLKKRFKR